MIQQEKSTLCLLSHVLTFNRCLLNMQNQSMSEGEKHSSQIKRLLLWLITMEHRTLLISADIEHYLLLKSNKVSALDIKLRKLSASVRNNEVYNSFGWHTLFTLIMNLYSCIKMKLLLTL